MLPLVAAGALFGIAACEENVPTSLDPDLLPVTPRSVEIRLAWSEFGSDLRVFGGYGRPIDLGHAILANEFEGTVDARTLVQFGAFPDSVTVPDDEGTSRRSAVEYQGGRLVVRFDTTGAPGQPITLVLRSIQHRWHPGSTTWDLAVDTVNDVEPWPVPGGGPADSVGSGVWQSQEGDSATIEIDPDAVAQLGDTTNPSRGLRLEVAAPGERLEVEELLLRLDGVPEIRTDTTVSVTASPRVTTFIYAPFPEPPPDGIRIGGVPAWRTVLDMDVPTVFEQPHPVCERIPCPFELEPERINAASLILRSEVVEPAFRPTDTVRLDARPVLAPEALPKAPLGNTFVGTLGRPMEPGAFAGDAGEEVAIPVTAFVRDLVRGETSQGEEPPGTVALLSVFEPLSLAFASFAGPGEQGEPFLRLIVTVADTVEIR